MLAGAGMGFLLGPASTDAVNRASRLSYGEATGITQTVRNYAASLGLAILGTLLVTELRSQLTTSFEAQGLGRAAATSEAARLSQGRPGSSAGAIPHFVRLDFAYATRSVLYGMAIVMAAAAVVAVVGLRRGAQEELDGDAPDREDAPDRDDAPDREGATDREREAGQAPVDGSDDRELSGRAGDGRSDRPVGSE